MKDFGAKLTELRIEKNITQRELAEQVHVTKQSVSKWEQGKSFPDVETVEILARFFGITVDAMISNGAQDNRKVKQCEKILRQNKVITAVTIILCFVIIFLSVSTGFIVRENYFLKNLETTTIHEVEMRVIERRIEDYSVIIELNLYNTSDVDKTIINSNFTYSPNSLKQMDTGFDTYILAKNSSTATIYLYSNSGYKIKETINTNRITIFYLGQIVASIKI